MQAANMTRKPKRQIFACDHCQKSFSSNSNLLRHVREICQRTSENLPTFECSECHVKFIRKSVLKRHIKLRHTCIRELECLFCSKRFPEKWDLQRHIRRIHEKPKEYIAPKISRCEMCPKDFSCFQSLKRHCETIHRECFADGENPFICLQCNKEFNGEIYLKRHVKRIHQSERKKSLICFHCSKKFRGKEDIRAHIRYVHSANKLNAINRKTYTYRCLKCHCQFDAVSVIQDHYEEKHDIHFEYEELKFETIEKFEEWKQRMNRSTTTQMKVCKKWRTTDYTAIKYICHRSGIQERVQMPRKRSLKLTGSKKLGGYCPMEIVVKILNRDGTCEATFQKTHVGHPICHEDEIRYTTRFSAEEKLKIVRNIKIAASEAVVSKPEKIHANFNNNREKTNASHRVDRRSDHQYSMVITENMNHTFLLEMETRDSKSSEENEDYDLCEEIVEMDQFGNHEEDDFDISNVEEIEVYEETDVTEEDINLVVDEFRRSLLRVKSKAELHRVRKTFIAPVVPFLESRAIASSERS